MSFNIVENITRGQKWLQEKSTKRQKTEVQKSQENKWIIYIYI